jgi:hypothetical protein
MAMSPLGTFDYVGTIPERRRDGTIVCTLSTRGKIPSEGRLTGHAPTLSIAEAGLTPDPSPTRPRVMRSRLSLTAASRRASTVQAAHFHVDRGLVASMRAGDTLHLVRTHSADLGLSILRNDLLVAAVGAVASLPLGADVTVSSPYALICEAEAILRSRDPDFSFRETPLEIVVAGERPRIVSYFNGALGPFIVYVMHGCLRGIPGDAECAALSRVGLCGDVVASCSAMLLAPKGALSMECW